MEGERAEDESGGIKVAIKDGVGCHSPTEGMPTKPQRQTRSLSSCRRESQAALKPTVPLDSECELDLSPTRNRSVSRQPFADARCAQYELSISIQASRPRVWRGLTDQLGSWWLPDFHMLGPDSLVTLEPRAGGRLYEQKGARELLWYTVLAISPEESLDLAGYCTADYGGPSTTMLSIRLVGEKAGTRLTIRDSLFGHVTDGQVESLSSGWTQLFTAGLKSFLEGPV